LVVVQFADTSVKLVPAGIDPLLILAVSSRSVPPGTMEDILTNTSELDTDPTGAPAVEVARVNVTGAWLVSINANSDICKVMLSPAVHT